MRGMDITVVTSAKTDDEGRAILKALGLPVQDQLTTTLQVQSLLPQIRETATRKGYSPK